MNNFNEYTRYLQEQNLATRTIELYRSAISRYYGDREFNNDCVNIFFKELVKNHEPSTCQAYRQALVSYARFLRIEIDWKRINKVIPQRVRKFFVTITLEELSKLKEARLEKSEKLYQRNNLMFDFLFYSGVRINELVNIKHQDWQGNSLRVLGKGNKVRNVLLTPDLIQHINPQKSGYLFPNRSGSILSAHQFREVLRQRIKKAGIKKWVSPHTFRRSFATLLNNNGAHLTTIQTLLGHSNISTTANYIHNDYDYLYEDYSKILKQPKLQQVNKQNLWKI